MSVPKPVPPGLMLRLLSRAACQGADDLRLVGLKLIFLIVDSWRVGAEVVAAGVAVEGRIPCARPARVISREEGGGKGDGRSG